MFDDLYKSTKRTNTEKTNVIKDEAPIPVAPSTKSRYIQVDPSQKHLVTREPDPVLKSLRRGSVVILNGEEIRIG